MLKLGKMEYTSHPRVKRWGQADPGAHRPAGLTSYLVNCRHLSHKKPFQTQKTEKVADG